MIENETLELDLRLLIKHTDNLQHRKLHENAVSITFVFRTFESKYEHFVDLETPNSSFFKYSIAIGRP